jgi:prophage antirepressor-like protein
MSIRESGVTGVDQIYWRFTNNADTTVNLETVKQEKTVAKTKALQIFSFEGKETRVVDVNGEPWWVAKDVCDVLGIQNARDEVAKCLDEDEKGVDKIDTLGGKQEMNVISESGLYALIMRSNKPEAKRFRKWVTSEVLPAIRKTGSYSAPAAVSANQELRDLIERNRGVIGKVALGKLVLMLAASIQAAANDK